MQLEMIRFLQKFSSPVLDFVMEGFTVCAEPVIPAAVLCAVYWCFNKRLGRYLALALGVTLCVNGAVKDIFRIERMFNRPDFDGMGIISHRVETATGYSFPSMHTQAAATFWGGFCMVTRKPVIRSLLIFFMIAVGISRMYLGVHYPLDVLFGLLLGAAVTVLMHQITVVRENPMMEIGVCVSAGLAALLLSVSRETLTGAALLLGMLFGSLFEDRFVRFETEGKSFIGRLLRYVLGMVFIAVAYTAPRAFFPSAPAAEFFRYALVAFSVTGLYPYVFTKLRY